VANDKTTPLVAEMAKDFISLVRTIEPGWRKAYLRFSWRNSASEVKGSYVHAGGVDIINVIGHKDFFHPANKKGQDLLVALGKTEGLFLLVVDSSFDYEIKFEYQDMNRWKISKLGGGTGVPEGIE
jgi:hypothetical protein